MTQICASTQHTLRRLETALLYLIVGAPYVNTGRQMRKNDPRGGTRWGQSWLNKQQSAGGCPASGTRQSRRLIEVNDVAAQMMSNGTISGRLVADFQAIFDAKSRTLLGFSSTPRGVRSLFYRSFIIRYLRKRRRLIFCRLAVTPFRLVMALRPIRRNNSTRCRVKRTP